MSIVVSIGKAAESGADPELRAAFQSLSAARRLYRTHVTRHGCHAPDAPTAEPFMASPAADLKTGPGTRHSRVSNTSRLTAKCVADPGLGAAYEGLRAARQ